VQRKLAAILSADVVGYSRMMELDEAGTLDRLKENRVAIFDPKVAAHGGRVFKLMGDGALVEFPSVVSAVACAIEIQQAVAAANAGVDEAKRIRYRIGVNLGDIIVEGDDIYGEGVNVAARLQSLADPGCVALSRTVRDQVAGKVSMDFHDLGEHSVKTGERPVHVFALKCGIVPTLAQTTDARAQQVSVCVLPFANISGDPEQEYFSDGISEDIITDLSKVSALAVVSRNTAFIYKGKSVDVGQVARQLRVSHVLEGSVRKAGNRVRITAQLIEGASDSHVWAERYDRDLDDIFAVQDEISAAIVRALKLRLMPSEKKAIETRSTTNPQAYKLYLMARSFHLMGQGRHRPIIIRMCRRAVDIDPGYARAWALLATCQSNIRLLAGGTEGDNGWEAADKALSLDPNLAEAHAARGRILADAGRLDEAWAEHEVALALDPESYDVNSAAARCALAMRRNNEAIRALEKAAAINESDTWALGMSIQAYDELKDGEGMKWAARRLLERAERAVAVEPDHAIAMGFGVLALATLGEKDRAKEWAERAMLIDPDDINLIYNLGCSMVALGEFDMALRLLAPAFDRVQEQSLHWFRVDASLDPIRLHPEFRKMMGALARRLGHPLKENET